MNPALIIMRTQTQNLTLLTDLYEITMMQGYFKTGNQDIVVFDAFYRDNPCGGGYAIACGLEQFIEYVQNLQFTTDDIRYLESLEMFDDEFLKYLSTFRFSGSIYSVPEGTIIFPREPFVKIIAPIMEAQLVESALLNIINHQSLIATKASRVCHAAKGDGVMEFGLRRAQGPDSGILGARAAVIGGCIGTSNVLAGQTFNIPVKGTHAHSWIMSFPDEYTAFKTYAMLYPNACTLLVDTYDSLQSGVPNAIRVFREMREAGIEMKNFGIRMDSGDLAYLSKKARTMLDEAGFPDAIISASNDLDEYLIEALKSQGAQITSWGVGTNLITSEDCPAFGGVYKLAAIRGENGQFVPKIKLSDNTEKVTNPGNKEIYRIYDRATGKIRADLICLEEETFNESEDMVLFDPVNTWKRTRLLGGSYTMRKLLEPIFDEGKCVYTSPTVWEIRDVCNQEKATLWDENMRFVHPAEVYVDLSNKLYEMKQQVFNEMSAERSRSRNNN